jgi:hypothetical protein
MAEEVLEHLRHGERHERGQSFDDAIGERVVGQFEP